MESGSRAGSRGNAWPLGLSSGGSLTFLSVRRESVEREPGRKPDRLFLTVDLSCSLMLISLCLSLSLSPCLFFFEISQSLSRCPGTQSSPGSLLLPSSSIPQATSPSSQPSTGMQLLWASILTTARTSCLLSWWAPTPLPPISSLQVNQFLPGLLSLSRHGSLLCLVWRPAG